MIKNLSISILFVLACQCLYAHGGHMAVFKYQIEANIIDLEFRIESSVLQHFALKDKCESYEIATAWCLVQYINSQSILNIDDNQIHFELESSRKDNGFFVIKMSAKADFSACKNIQLSNKCFLEFDRKFENRIIIQKSNEVKSYLINRKNTEINIRFNK